MNHPEESHEADECPHERRRQLFKFRQDGFNEFRCEDCGEIIAVEIDPVLRGCD